MSLFLSTVIKILHDPGSNVKRIYYVSRLVKDVLAVGQKIKEKQSARECEGNSCSFRITSEGLPVIVPYMTKQILMQQWWI
ncbi:hypothetical protein YC2023_006904 [Brassica napus]